MTARRLLVVATCALAVWVPALRCSTWASEPQPTARTTEEPKAENSQGTELLAEIVTGNNRFAASLYARLKDDRAGNLFFSPYSISTALAMTSAGAAGDTGRQMAEVLQLTVPEPELHQAMGQLMKRLLAKHKGYQLRVANPKK